MCTTIEITLFARLRASLPDGSQGTRLIFWSDNPAATPSSPSIHVADIDGNDPPINALIPIVSGLYQLSYVSTSLSVRNQCELKQKAPGDYPGLSYLH